MRDFVIFVYIVKSRKANSVKCVLDRCYNHQFLWSCHATGKKTTTTEQHEENHDKYLWICTRKMFNEVHLLRS